MAVSRIVGTALVFGQIFGQQHLRERAPFVSTACVSGRVNFYFMWNDTDTPLAYLITFRWYGTWLHGDERGSIDRFHNKFETSYIEADKIWHQFRENNCWNFSHSPWADKGSRRRLWNERSIELAIDYVINGQGGELPKFD